MKVSCYIITPKKIGKNIDVVQNVLCHFEQSADAV